MVSKHLAGILNAVVPKATNARIQRIKAMACGYRNRERFRTAIQFHLVDWALFEGRFRPHDFLNRQNDIGRNCRRTEKLELATHSATNARARGDAGCLQMHRQLYERQLLSGGRVCLCFRLRWKRTRRLATEMHFMKPKHIVSVIGARPQFVKASVVSRAMMFHVSGLMETVVHTGQHFDANMSQVFFEELEIPQPQVNLGIGGGSHGRNTGRMLEAIEGVLLEQTPDVVLVYGDTDSTLAGALCAAKLHIPVAHVEAGLRSNNRRMPEEINRVLTDHLSTVLFTPTMTATANLAREGIGSERIEQVGDVMLDVANFYRTRARRPAALAHDAGFVLATLHRAENTDDPDRLAAIMGALAEIAIGLPVLMPLHPRTRKCIERFGISVGSIEVLDPVGYLEMVWLLEQCGVVVTDSGGLQKEAYFFGKPCVTTRDETEWTELVSLGANVLVGAHPSKIREAIRLQLAKRSGLLARCAAGQSPYGSGNAAELIAERLMKL